MSVPEGGIYYLEIVTPDVEAACGLYGALHAWSFGPARAELGGARVAVLAGGSQCGIRAPMHEQEHPTVRTYLRVTDIAGAVARAEALGAETLLGPMEIPDHGTIAIYRQGGIEQGLWQTD